MAADIVVQYFISDLFIKKRENYIVLRACLKIY